MAKVHLKVRSGLTLRGTTADPIDAEEGDLIFRSDLTPARYREYRSGQWADIHDSRFVKLVRTADAATTGTATTLAAFSTPFISVTNASLVSISMIPAGEDGQVITLLNNTGVVVSLNDDTGATAANRIRTGTNKPVKMKDNVALTLIYDGTDSRWHVVGGPGGDSGDANRFTLEMEHRLEDSFYEWMTPSVIALDGSTLVDGSSTASLNLADDSYDLDVGETVVTANLFGAGFLGEDTQAATLETVVEYLDGSVDTNPTVELSINGGDDWNTVTMERIGISNRLHGRLGSIVSSTVETLQEYDVANQNSNQTINTALFQKRATSFTVGAGAKERVDKVSLYLNTVGTPQGNFRIKIVRADGANPSENTADLIYDGGQRPMSSLSSGDNTVVCSLSSTLTTGTYWITIETDATYKATYNVSFNALRWKANNAGPSASKAFDGSSWATASAISVCYLVEGIQLDLRLRVTASLASKMTAFVAFFGDGIDGVVTGDESIQFMQVDGDLNPTSFTLTNFLPDPTHLKVYDTYSHQVYRYPTFDLQGYTVTFAAGSFNVPGEKWTLVFDQSGGGGFDNSDTNASLMAANGLGSTDASIDKSAAGVGVKLRSPDGTLWQMRVLDDGSILTEEV